MFNSRSVFFLYSNSTVLEVRSEVPYLFAKITWTFFAIYCIKNYNIGDIWWSIIYFRFWFLKTVKVLFEKDKFDISILSQSLYLLKSLVQIFFGKYKYQVILIRSLNWRVVEAPQLCNLTVLCRACKFFVKLNSNSYIDPWIHIQIWRRCLYFYRKYGVNPTKMYSNLFLMMNIFG